MDLDDVGFERMLQSGNERPAVWVLRAHRVCALLALGLFVLWAIIAFGDVLQAAEDAAWWSFVTVLVLSLLLKVTGRWLDRRAMRKDMQRPGEAR